MVSKNDLGTYQYHPYQIKDLITGSNLYEHFILPVTIDILKNKVEPYYKDLEGKRGIKVNQSFTKPLSDFEKSIRLRKETDLLDNLRTQYGSIKVPDKERNGNYWLSIDVRLNHYGPSYMGKGLGRVDICFTYQAYFQENKDPNIEHDYKPQKTIKLPTHHFQTPLYNTQDTFITLCKELEYPVKFNSPSLEDVTEKIKGLIELEKTFENELKSLNQLFRTYE
jgi:hypothetical protein